MLKDDQAAELLRRCESIAGKKLSQVRGNLGQPQTRASAVWELLVLEAFSTIGKVEYEPEGESCPDVMLIGDDIGAVWIEAAFLYPRFWRNDRKSDEIVRWIYELLNKNKIAAFKVSYHFHGDDANKAGPTKKLPQLHEKKSFLGCPELSAFLARIEHAPVTVGG
ncbi:MAG: hypothetical protein ACYS6W_18310 [Planctomycetota bacterium]|jgi:hypothetical protein